MKNRYLFIGIFGFFLIVITMVSALITATGAFGNDPGEKVNRIDFVWSAAGFIILVFSFWKIRNQKT